MLDIRCFGVCACQLDKIVCIVCIGRKSTQRACVRDLPRGRKDEGRKVWERPEGHCQQKRAAETRQQEREREQSREELSAEGSRRDQSTGQISQEMRAGQREDQSAEVRKAVTSTCWCRVDQRKKMSQHSLSLCGSFAQIHARDSLKMRGELHKSVKVFSPLGANPSPIVCSSFLPSTRLCILCAYKEMWSTPGWW